MAGDIAPPIFRNGTKNIKWLSRWMDSRNRVQKVFVDKQTDLSKWMQGIPAVYTFDLRLKGVTPGSYYWAVGLVDTTKDNAIGLEMAVPGEHVECRMG